MYYLNPASLPISVEVAMTRFYEKLADPYAPAFMDWEYPPAATRVKMAKILSIEFGENR